jgi:hypothetical protein
MTHHYPTRDELIARARAAGEPDLCALRFDLDWAEVTWDGAKCDHKVIDMSCANCRLDRATWRYRDAWCWHFGARVSHEIKQLTYDELRPLYAQAVKDHDQWLLDADQWFRLSEYLEAGLRRYVIGNAMEKILAGEAADRLARRNGTAKSTRTPASMFIGKGRYKKTGKKVLIDGALVPVVRKVESTR